MANLEVVVLGNAVRSILFAKNEDVGFVEVGEVFLAKGGGVELDLADFGRAKNNNQLHELR